MKSLLLAFSVILVAQPLLAFPTPQKGVPAQCGDPTFACQDLQSAKACGVVSTCIHDIWATMSVPDDNDEICDICKEMVKEARDQLLSNMTQEEIKEVFEGSCKLLPVKIIAEGCIKIVDEIIPELVEMLASRMDPNMVCTVSGMCFPTKRITFKKELIVGDDLECEFCEHLIEHVKDLITTNTTMEEFKNALLNFCNVTGKFAEKCTDLVNNYYDALFGYIKNLDSKGMCTLIGLCTNSERSETPLIKLIPATKLQKKTPLIEIRPADPVDDLESFPLVRLVPANFQTNKALKESNDVFQPQLPVERFGPILEPDRECALCKAFSFYLETDLAGDKSEEAIQKTIDSICDKWMRSYPNHCSQIASKYSEKMKKSISTGIEFNDLCLDIEACPFEEDSTDELEVSDLPKIEESPFCDLCKDVLSEVEKQLNDPDTKEKLEDLFGQVCNMLPKSVRDDCVNFVNQNIENVIIVLKDELKPNTFCPSIGLCTDGPRLEVSPTVKDLECNICKDVFTSFRQSLQDPASKEIVETFLEEGCRSLPGPYGAACKKYVEENIDSLMKILVEEMNPESVCALLSICPASVFKATLIEIPRVNDVECDLCKEVVEKVEDMIKDKKTEDEIKQALDRVCSYLPSSMATKCQNFVNQYTNLLIDLLTQDLDPDMVCAALKVCPEKAQSLDGQSKAKDIECQGCQYALHFLQEKLMDAQTQEEVKSFLKRTCSLMPEPYLKNCDAFVDEFGSSFLVQIAQEIDPSVLCFKMQMCSNQTSIFDKIKEEISLNRFQMDECSICTTVVDYMDKLIEEDDVDKEIDQLAEKVCGVLPSSFRKHCTKLLEDYGSYILQKIGQMVNSKEVCQDIDMCPRSPKHVHLIGGSKCTFGPSYWCKSKVHAASCKAESFCKENVWKN